MKEQTRFWFVHARYHTTPMCLAVAAFTERSARVQATEAMGPHGTIESVTAVPYAHAWKIDLGWQARSEIASRHASEIPT